MPGSRLEPSYQAAESRRLRNRLREAIDGVVPRVGERYRMVTLTAPTIYGVGLKNTIDLFDVAWGLLRKRLWWKTTVRGATKSLEFTLGCKGKRKSAHAVIAYQQVGFHVHIHLLVISKWINRDDLKREWTICFKEAASRMGVPSLTIKTADLKLGVYVREVTHKRFGSKKNSLEAAIQEVCKYITKSESWRLLPSSELARVVDTLRGRRMVEMVGAFRRTARQSSQARRGVTYLDTRDTSDGRRRGVLPQSTRTKKQKSLLALADEMIPSGRLKEWLQILEERVTRAQEFRRSQLVEYHPEAIFAGMDGREWFGDQVQKSIGQAHQCLNLLETVGVTEFGVTTLPEGAENERRPQYKVLQASELRRSLRHYIKRNRTQVESLLIRPFGNLIQVDECNGEDLQRLAAFSFLGIETSPGNFQSWLVLPHKTEKSDCNRIRNQLLRSLPGTDRGASGSMRFPGSISHKPGRDKFCVRIVSSNPGRFVTAAELDAAGLLASGTTSRPSEELPPLTLATARKLLSRPDYQRCLREVGPRKK